MRHLANIRDSASNIATDLQLLKQFAQPKMKIAQADIMSSSGLNQLGDLLKSKNAKYNYSDEHRQREQNWVLARNGDIRPLLQRSKHVKLMIEKKQEQKSKQSNSYLFITPSTLKLQNLYITKNAENSIFTCIQFTEAHRQFRSKVSNRLLRGSKPSTDFKIASLQQINSKNLSQQARKKKIQSYLRAMRNLFEIQEKFMYKQWTVAFKGSTKLKIWEILNNLIPKQLQQRFEQNTKLSKLAIYSLRMVEEQFNSILPSNYESIRYYLTSNYLRKMAGKYQNQGSLGPIWAIAYVLYKAGRKLQFYRYLPDSDIRGMFQSADKSISQENPIKIQGLSQNNDVFHDQLVYALAGTPKYSSDYLCDPNTHDIAWVFLRNVGIFQSGQARFKQLTEDLCISYRSSGLDQIKIKNLFYLFCFDQLIEIGPNQLMDQYDFLHFLIVLYHSPTFKHLYQNNRGLMIKKLTQRLTEFLEVLLMEQKKQAKYYIALMPHQSLANEISTLIAKLNLITRMNWNELSKELPSKVYEELVYKTCEKQIIIHKDYILAAEKSEQLLKNYELTVNFILQMFIKYIIEHKQNTHQLKRGYSIVQKIFKKDQKLQIQYGQIFQFFKQYENLNQLLQKRNQDILYQYLKNCKHVLISDQIRVDTENVLQKLISKNGFDCYIEYVKDIIKGYEMALTKMNRIYDLQELQRLTLSALTTLINRNNYRQFAKNQSVISLMRTLNQALFRYN